MLKDSLPKLQILNAKMTDTDSLISPKNAENLALENEKLKEELQNIKELYEFATTSFNDGIWDWNLINDEVYISPRWKEILGYQEHELPNKINAWLDLLHPGDLNASLDNVQQHIEDGSTSYESVHRLKHKKGKWRWMLARGTIVRDSAGKAVRIFGSQTDITKLRHVEEALLERERELHEIVSISPDGIVTFNHQNKISSVNPAFLTMTGFTIEELRQIDKEQFNQKMLEITDSKHSYKTELHNEHSFFMWIMGKNANEKESSAVTNKTKFNFKKQRTNHRVIRVTRYLINTSVSPVIIYFRDVTLETEMDQMKNEFLSVAAHELRMPLSSIYGYSELLMTRNFDDMTRNDILQAIHGLCTSVVELINQLLDLAKIEAKCANAFEFKSLSLAQIIKETLSDFKIYGDFRKVEVHYFIDDSALIYGDLEQIKRALINILSNALKYSPNGQNVQLEIRVRTNELSKEQIGIIVKDKGIGIAPENLEHIFERFWRADNVNDIIGTGLGMSLVKEIVDLHHGEIDVKSTLGKGTTVSIWFPITQISN